MNFHEELNNFCDSIINIKQKEEIAFLMLQGAREDSLIDLIMNYYYHNLDTIFLPKLTLSRSTLDLVPPIQNGKQFDAIIFKELNFDDTRKINLLKSPIEVFIEVKHNSLREKISRYPSDYGPVQKNVLFKLGSSTELINEIQLRMKLLDEFMTRNIGIYDEIHALLFTSYYHHDIKELENVVLQGRSKDKKYIKNWLKNTKPQDRSPFDWICEMMADSMEISRKTKIDGEMVSFNWHPVKFQNSLGERTNFKLILDKFPLKLANQIFYVSLGLAHWKFTNKNSIEPI